MSEDTPSTRFLKRFDDAEGLQKPWISLWRDSAQYVHPSSSEIGTMTTGPKHDLSHLFDSTAIQSNLTYAAGCLSWLSPKSSQWFGFDAPPGLGESDDSKRWLGNVTDNIRSELTSSNFYEQIHSVYLNDGGFGTSCLFVESTSEGLNFQSWDIGSYSILENSKGMVDTVFREYEKTWRQIEQEFGEDAVPEEQRTPDNYKRKATIVHGIYPRADADRDKMKIDGPNMPIASIYVLKREKTIIRNAGFNEMPVAVHRHRTFQGSVYGLSPAWQAIPDVRQLNDMQMNMDILAEVAANPRFLLPQGHEGEVSLFAGSHTYFKDQNMKPQEWLTGGRYDVGQDRVEMRRKAVQDAFHVQLFQMFEQFPAGREMTAYEVSARQQDRLTAFSPTYARKDTELIQPILRTVFAMMYRAGAFPDPPDEMWIDNGDMQSLAKPEVVLSSRVALAIKAGKSRALIQGLNELGPLIEMNPALMDNIDTDEAMREHLRASGVSEDVIISEMKRDEERGARAEQQAEMQEQEQAMEAVEAGSKASASGLLDRVEA